jgi:hypothetical protein
VGGSRDRIESAISMYFGAVVVANMRAFKWVVQEFAFASGRYELGVGKPGFTIMLMAKSNLESLPNNKSRQSLQRRFRQLAKYEKPC